MIKWELESTDTIEMVYIKFNVLRSKISKEGHQVGLLGFNQLWEKGVNYASNYNGADPTEKLIFDYAKTEYIEHRLKNIDTIIVMPFRIGNKTTLIGMVKIGLRWEGHGKYYLDTDYEKKDATALYLRMLRILRYFGDVFNIRIEDMCKWAENKSIIELDNFVEEEIRHSNIVGTVIADALESEGGSDE